MPTEIERLYREHRAGLVRLVERELHNRQDAEDVVQTAFLDAHRALERGTIPRNPRAWLAAIALNAGRRLRRRRLNPEPLEDYAVQEASRMPEIRAALASLPREQRLAVLYRDVLGLSYAEAAEQMGTSVNAVTMLLHRGRRRLRQTLGVTAGGVGLSRWLRRAGMPQLAAVKGAAAVVVAAGVATGGVVAARAVAPVGTHLTVVPATRPASVTAGGGGTSGGALDSVRRHVEKADGSRAGAIARSTTRAAGPSSSTSILRLPAVAVPTLPIPTLPATVTVVTPITATTVTASVGTTATVTTPLTTVTVPVP